MHWTRSHSLGRGNKLGSKDLLSGQLDVVKRPRAKIYLQINGASPKMLRTYLQ